MISEDPTQIARCVKAAQRALGLVEKEYDFTRPSLSSASLPVAWPEDSKAVLYPITDGGKLKQYILTYQKAREGKQLDKPVTISGCYVNLSSIPDIPDFRYDLIFENCKVVFNGSEFNKATIRQISCCDIEIEGSVRLHEVSMLSSSYVEGAISFHTSRALCTKVIDCEVKGSLLGRIGLSVQTSDVLKIDASNKCDIDKSKIKKLRQLAGCKRSIITDSHINELEMIGPKFSEKFYMENVTISTPSEISGVEFSSGDVGLVDVHFSNNDSGKYIGAYRQLKEACRKAGYEHGVILFHALELETHYNVFLKKECPFELWPERISSWFQREVTDYGRNLMRPLLVLCSLFICGAYFNIVLGTCRYGITCKITSQDFLNCSLGSLLRSFSHTLGPLSLALPEHIRSLPAETGWLTAIDFLQIIISSTIWFLLGLMVRRRFRI